VGDACNGCEIKSCCVLVEFFSDGENAFATFGGISGRSQPRKDPPIEKDLALTLEEVYSGCTKKMKISRRVSNEVSAGVWFQYCGCLCLNCTASV